MARKQTLNWVLSKYNAYFGASKNGDSIEYIAHPHNEWWATVGGRNRGPYKTEEAAKRAVERAAKRRGDRG